jgi:hypothetical protein
MKSDQERVDCIKRDMDGYITHINRWSLKDVFAKLKLTPNYFYLEDRLGNKTRLHILYDQAQPRMQIPQMVSTSADRDDQNGLENLPIC